MQMTRAHKIINLIGVPLPFVGLIAAVALLWDRAVGPLELGLMAGLYVITCLGVTLGWILGGGLVAALTALLWGGFVRVFLLHHVTWSINSICHFFGRKRFDIEDESRNVFWLAPLSMGESWHHNHHAFPTSAFHGLRWWERLADPTGLLIALLEKLGLVWNVVRVSPERQRATALPTHPKRLPTADASTWT